MCKNKITLLFLIALLFLTIPVTLSSTPTYHFSKPFTIKEGLKVHFGDDWISTSGTDITVTKYFVDDWLNYTCNAGTQQIHNGAKPSKVYFDNVEQTEGDTWSWSGDIVTITPSSTDVALFWGADNGVGSAIWSDDSYWYMSIKDNPTIYPNNDELIDWLINNHVDYPTMQWQSWTNVVYNCYEDTSLYSVYNEDDSRYESIPFPEPYPVDIPLEADHAVTIIDWYREKVWDTWNVRASGGTYIAGDAWELPLYGSGLDDTGVGGPWTCGGSGCPSVAYLIRPEEIEAGVINHVLGCALRTIGPYTDGSRFDTEEGFVHPPAVHTDRETTSSNPNQIPAGARIQLDPAINLDSLGLSTTAKIIAKALQDYGMVVAESGGSWHIYAEHDYTADWNPPSMGTSILSAIGGLVTPSYKPWRIIDFVLYPPADDMSEYETSSGESFQPWTDNFEYGNLTKWTSINGQATATSTYAHSGTYSANLTATPSSGGWLSGWDKRVKFTLDHNDFSETLTDFPVYIHLGASAGRYDEDVTFIFDEVGSNSRKIAFTSSDGQTELYGDIERWDSTEESAQIWVKVPSISNTTDTVLYLYYDNDHADNPYINDSGVGNSVNVWDSDFMMVQHMTGASYSVLDDATSNNNDVTAEHGTPQYNQAGRCAKAVDFESWSDEYLNVTDDDTLDGYTVGMTLESWVKLESLTDNTIFGKYQTSGNERAYYCQAFDATHLEFAFSVDGTNYCGYRFTGQTYSTGVWYYLVFEWISNQTPKAYCNGNQLTAVHLAGGTTSLTINNAATDLLIGNKIYDNEDFDGFLDEIRLSNSSRSTWISSNYEVQRDQTTDWFTEETQGGGESASISHTVVSMSALFMRSYTRLEDLPDTNHTSIKLMEFQTASGNLIGSCMVYRLESNYYWRVQVSGQEWYEGNMTQSTITVDTWYAIELYVNASTNGNITLWVDEQLKCQDTGDYSSFDTIEKTTLFSYLYGVQSSAKTVYFDNFEVNNERIYGKGSNPPVGTSVLFGASAGGYPLENVLINGTYPTDTNGYYDWANLTYNTLYTFIIDPPVGYYPLWMLDIEGNFSWNGSCFIVHHNVTQDEVNLKAYFTSETNRPYINATDAKITSASLNNYLLDFTVYNASGTSTTDIYTSGNGNATYVYNSQSWSYNAGTDIIQVVASHSSSKSIEVSWGFMQTYSLEVLNTEYKASTVPYITNSNASITALSSLSIKTTFTVTLASGTSQTDVNTRNWGLTNVTGQSSYIHDEANDNLTIYANHSSDVIITVIWEGGCYSYAYATNNLVYGDGFHVLFESGSSLAFQHDINKTVMLQIETGLLNSSENTVQVDSGGGYFYFTALNNTQITISYVGIDQVYVSGDQNSGNRLIGTDTSITVEIGNNVRISWRYLPWSLIDNYFMLGVGLAGIIMLISGPTWFARTFVKHGLDTETIEHLGYGMLMMIMGFGFVVVWLWPG